MPGMGSIRSTTYTVGISPKVQVPTFVLVGIGVALMVADLAGLVDIPDGVWVAVLAAGGVVVPVTGYNADPGDVAVVDSANEIRDLHDHPELGV